MVVRGVKILFVRYRGLITEILIFYFAGSSGVIGTAKIFNIP
jgi:hypothetical protein